MNIGENNGVFSTLDLVSGYGQTELEKQSKPTTAFSTPSGHHWQFARIPFG